MSRALRPLFVTVTWGAGGSTAAKSLELAEICQRQQGLTTCLHLTCTNMNRKLVDEALEEAKALGIRNILALRGDPPRSEEYNIEEDDSNKDFTWAIDLVRYIRKMHGDYFCLGVAAYPEGHADESYPEVQDPERDIPYLVEKTKAGADFIMTQLTYDVAAYTKFENRLRNHESGVFKSIPIIPGLMPIQSYQILKRITKLSHAKVPPDIIARIDSVKSDDEVVKRVGVDVLSEIVEDIRKIPSPGPRGLHFYTLNLEKSVAFILERCKLIPASSPASDSDMEDSAIIISPPLNGDQPRPLDRRRASSINSQPHNRLLVSPPTQKQPTSSTSSHSHEAVADYASGVPAELTSRHTTLSISEGEGALGREATWDDFPNGRWGDARSPAFGEIDGYGPSLHVSPATARKLWGHPKSHADISILFRSHMNGKLDRVPWSEATGMNPETETIRTELLTLIDKKGYWTLASQPAVNGVRSSHPIFGWGPPHSGFVFQKPFVEFFVTSASYHNDLKPRLMKHKDEVSFFATNVSGDFEESHPHSLSNTGGTKVDTGAVNAVTWGVFRGKEIVTPTIIEEVSFRAWGEEAYGIWEEWRRVFARGSEEERFLETVREDVWLVNVVGMKFAGGEGGRLWEVLSQE
jgi:methylenetetrahydrofolate reductase (NADPH)